MSKIEVILSRYLVPTPETRFLEFEEERYANSMFTCFTCSSHTPTFYELAPSFYCLHLLLFHYLHLISFTNFLKHYIERILKHYIERT